ncbi:hypothetical protein ACRBEV_10225 [Methylobacterium phyllosphaerae]
MKDIFQEQIPEVTADERLMRAARIYLIGFGYEVTGHEGDAPDLRAIALFQGLSPDQFEVITDQDEPLLCLDENSLAKLANTEGGAQVVERLAAAQASQDKRLLPEFIPNPNDPEGYLMNSSGVIELAMVTDTPQAKQLLKDYHQAEADIASKFPFWSENKIRDEAMKQTLQRADR